MFTYFKRYHLRITGSLLLTLMFVMHVLGWFPLPLIDDLEHLSYDARLIYNMPSTVDKRIVIVDIDEDSLRKEGHWPWSREKLAQLVNQLFNAYKISVLGFDVVFAERDTDFGLDRMEKLLEIDENPQLITRFRELRGTLDKDKIFANAIADRPVVLGYYFTVDQSNTQNSGTLSEPIFENDGFMSNTVSAVKGSAFGSNVSILQSSAMANGFFSNPLIDEDGVIRRVPLLHEYQGALYESLSLAVTRIATDSIVIPDLSELSNEAGFPSLTHLDLSGARIPVDAQAAIHVPYRGVEGSYRYVPASDVLNETVLDPKLLENAIVLIGTTAIGLVDHRTTPMQGVFPGVEIHANVISALLDGNILVEPEENIAIEFLICLILGVFVSLTFPLYSPLIATLVFLVLEGGVIGSALWLWRDQNMIVPMATTSLMLLILYIYHLAYGYFIETRTQRRLRQAFGAYLSPDLVNNLADDSSESLLQGRNREMTYLFTDLEKFTQLSETMTADKLVELLSEYLDHMCQIIMGEGGLIDKFVGDSIVAVFNAPFDQDDHELRAVNSAVKLDLFAESFRIKKNQEGIAIGRTRIGINTGPAVIGNIGGSLRFEYTAIGDNVNVASRFENANKTLGTRICISATTAQACRDISFRPVGRLKLPGKKELIEAFEPIAEEEKSSPRIVRYMEYYQRIIDGDNGVLPKLKILTSEFPDDPVIDLYYRRQLEGLNGVDIQTSK